MGGELCQNRINLVIQAKLDFDGQSQSPPKTIRILTILFCIFCPNLVVLALTRDELWCGQARGWQTHTHRWTCTHTHTDAGNDNTWRPKLGKKTKKNCHYQQSCLTYDKSHICLAKQANLSLYKHASVNGLHLWTDPTLNEPSECMAWQMLGKSWVCFSYHCVVSLIFSKHCQILKNGNIF